MRDQDHLILIAVGPDKVGLVQKISEFIVNRGGNIEDSRMAVLAGEFAQILLITGEDENLDQISKSISHLSKETGLAVWLKEPSGKKVPRPSLPYRLVASCMDHPGVVYRITSTLSKFEVNIESMETQTYPAPVTGVPMFRLEAIVTIPAGQQRKTVREALSEIEREENIDLEFGPVTGSSIS
ncbi:MAG TPA: ACT domain-containing protein [Acidobacteriota bacterium]|nr:ACT domain-containing protein [Acidobacteriota bacterium]